MVSPPNTGTNELRITQFTFCLQIQTDVNLCYVTNSGICEMILYVNQYSGYIEVGKNVSMISRLYWGGASADALM